MKKGLKILLFLGLCSPLMVNAANVSLDCPKTAKAGSEITCNIKLDSNDVVTGFQSNITASNGLTYKSYTKATGWDGSSSSSVFLVYGNNVSGSGKTLGTYKYTVDSAASGNLTVRLSGIEVTDTNADLLSCNSSIESTIRVMSSVNTLSGLTISGATIDFSKDVTTYNVELDSPKTTISATKTDQYSSVSGTGEKSLKYGKNTFNITVTAENGSKKTYTINITRPDNRSANNNLKSLSLSEGKITFNKNTTSYNVEVNSNVTKITISAELEDTKASFVKNYGPRSVNLNYGKNTIQIKIKSENEKEKVYTLNITRKDSRSSNTNLNNITVSSGNLVFNKDMTEYQISVENDVEKITIHANTEDTKSKVEVLNNKKLAIGPNEIKIKVTAENGSTKEYKIIVIRKEKDQVLDNNNYLQSITVAGYNINFNRETLTYNLTINKEEKLDIQAIPESDKSISQISGNENLKNGSIIKISVIAENGEIREYKINITKPVEKEKNDSKEENNSLMYIAIGVFGLGLVALIASVIIKKSKRQ